jgi:co-chaperonin GroES (HSP10)
MLKASTNFVIVKQEKINVGELAIKTNTDNRTVKIGKVLSVGVVQPQFAGDPAMTRCYPDDLVAYSPLSGFLANDEDGEEILILPQTAILAVVEDK